MTATINRSFLDGLGIAASSAPTPPPTAIAQPSDDDPSLWTAPEHGGFPDAFVALVDDLHDTEKRIDQANALVAEYKASAKPFPSGWMVRLQNLTTKRLALRKQLTDQYPQAVRATGELIARLNAQEAWLSISERDGRFGIREDVWLATLAAYTRMVEAIDRAFVTVAEETQDDPVAVSWTRAWGELRAYGFFDRADVEAAIKGWSNDPREVIRRAKVARGYDEVRT